MDCWRLIAERKIEEAMEEGAFDNLEGAGQPLDLEEDPCVDPALRMAHRLLKNNGFAPRWIEERKELASAAARLRDRRPEMEAAAWRGAAADLNRRIAVYNLAAPFALLDMLPL